jgi:hypothetical protein
MKESDRIINTLMAGAKDSYHGMGTPEKPDTKIEDGCLYLSEKALNTMKDVPGYLYLYCGPSSDEKNFEGLAVYYLKKSEYFSGENKDHAQIRLDADHHVYSCFFPRNKKPGK